MGIHPAGYLRTRRHDPGPASTRRVRAYTIGAGRRGTGTETCCTPWKEARQGGVRNRGHPYWQRRQCHALSVSTGPHDDGVGGSLTDREGNIRAAGVVRVLVERPGRTRRTAAAGRLKSSLQSQNIWNGQARERRVVLPIRVQRRTAPRVRLCGRGRRGSHDCRSSGRSACAGNEAEVGRVVRVVNHVDTKCLACGIDQRQPREVAPARAAAPSSAPANATSRKGRNLMSCTPADRAASVSNAVFFGRQRQPCPLTRSTCWLPVPLLSTYSLGPR